MTVVSQAPQATCRVWPLSWCHITGGIFSVIFVQLYWPMPRVIPAMSQQRNTWRWRALVFDLVSNQEWYCWWPKSGEKTSWGWWFIPSFCRVLAPSNRGGWSCDFWLPSTGVETWDNWFYGISPWKTTIWAFFSYHLLFKSKWEEWKAIIGLPSLRVYCTNLPDFWSRFCY